MARPGMRDFLEAALLAVVLATFVRTFLVQVLEIPSASMAPGLIAGDRVAVNRFIYGEPSPLPWLRPLLPTRDVRRGDVVVFRFPADPRRDFVKRCLGLPGDEVTIEAKQLFLDGEPRDETGYLEHRDPRTYRDSEFLEERFRRRDHFGPMLVPAASYFCLGDNRDNSNDSRFWGAVPEHFVRGRPVAILWSSEVGDPGKPRFGIWGRISGSWSSLVHYLGNLRWERSLRVVR